MRRCLVPHPPRSAAAPAAGLVSPEPPGGILLLAIALSVAGLTLTGGMLSFLAARSPDVSAADIAPLATQPKPARRTADRRPGARRSYDGHKKPRHALARTDPPPGTKRPAQH